MMRFSRAFAAFAGAVLAAGCNSSTASSGPPAAITKVSGDDQSGIVSTALTQPFVIKVADTAGVGVPNVAVVWTLTLGSGTLTVAKAKTDVNGQAEASLTLGAGAGTRLATVVVSAITKGTNSATFDAIAAAPATRDDWITYGHDGHRTSASQASLKSPLTTAWRFAPPSPVTNPYTVVFDALAAADGVYLQWGSTGTFFGFGTGTNVDRISPAGARVWSNTSWGADYNIGHWGSIYGNKFVFMDDGLGYLNLSNGTRAFNTSVDWWGETLPDATGLYVSQNWHVDGPQAFVGSLSATGTSRWKTNLVWRDEGGRRRVGSVGRARAEQRRALLRSRLPGLDHAAEPQGRVRVHREQRRAGEIRRDHAELAHQRRLGQGLPRGDRAARSSSRARRTICTSYGR